MYGYDNQKMESRRKAWQLWDGILHFISKRILHSKYGELDRMVLISHLEAVEEDEILKQNRQVQELVKEIYECMDDFGKMCEIRDRAAGILLRVG